MTKISPLLSQSILISQIIENRIVQGLVENTVILKKLQILWVYGKNNKFLVHPLN